jgi:hypothetical protein
MIHLKKTIILLTISFALSCAVDDSVPGDSSIRPIITSAKRYLWAEDNKIIYLKDETLNSYDLSTRATKTIAQVGQTVSLMWLNDSKTMLYYLDNVDETSNLILKSLKLTSGLISTHQTITYPILYSSEFVAYKKYPEEGTPELYILSLDTYQQASLKDGTPIAFSEKGNYLLMLNDQNERVIYSIDTGEYELLTSDLVNKFEEMFTGSSGIQIRKDYNQFDIIGVINNSTLANFPKNDVSDVPFKYSANAGISKDASLMAYSSLTCSKIGNGPGTCKEIQTYIYISSLPTSGMRQAFQSVDEVTYFIFIFFPIPQFYPPNSLTFSPDLRKLAFIKNGEIFAVDVR